MTVALW